MGKRKYICKYCDKEFIDHKYNHSRPRKYCSKECMNKAMVGVKKEGKWSYHICEHCGVEFERPKCKKKPNKYCSRQCHFDAKKKKAAPEERTCVVCGKVYKRYRFERKLKYCSQECRRADGWGSKSNQPFPQDVRLHRFYDQWRKAVYKRDNYTCQECGYNRKAGANYGKRRCFHAHHIKSFAEIIEEYGIDNLTDALECKELWSIDNGKTLCKSCHMKLHIKLRRAA